MNKLTFEWNFIKAASNKRKHGVSFEEAVNVFRDPRAITIADPNHSATEFREITIGLSDNVRLIVVSHTDRAGRIRIINARKATKKELKQYEK